jgi:hypothetical protein
MRTPRMTTTIIVYMPRLARSEPEEGFSPLDAEINRRIL